MLHRLDKRWRVPGDYVRIVNMHQYLNWQFSEGKPVGLFAAKPTASRARCRRDTKISNAGGT
jgi:hypothetical protein